jgi:hypothetical protein
MVHHVVINGYIRGIIGRQRPRSSIGAIIRSRASNGGHEAANRNATRAGIDKDIVIDNMAFIVSADENAVSPDLVEKAVFNADVFAIVNIDRTRTRNRPVPV